jgi:NAD/NADP transhydrogenase alpha subunit
MKIAVAAESDAGESQPVATPDTIRKMVALGADVAVKPAAET